MSCDPQTLASRSSCFFCLPSGYYYPIKLAILARWLRSLSPGADTSVAGLMASAGCFACPPGAQLGPIKLALICDATSGGGASPPGTPTNLLIDAFGSTTTDIKMDWTNNGPASTNVQIWKSVNGGAYALYATVGAVTTYHDITAGIPANDYWEYKVRGVNAGGNSAFSVPAAANNGFTDNVSAAISFPYLDVDFGDFILDPNPNVTTLSVPRLALVAGNMDLALCPALTAISIPTPGFTVGGNFDASFCTAMVTASFGAGATVAGSFGFQGCTAAVSISFPGIKVDTSLGGGNLDCSACTSLATVTLGAAIFQNDGQTITFDSDVLDQASVDAVLHRGVVSGVTTVTFELNSPGNSPPSATGLADKATLILAGNTVNTN